MDNISEKGFSYESPEKQKRSAVRLLILELFILAFAAIVIVITLIYFNIIPLTKTLPFVNRLENAKTAIENKATDTTKKGIVPAIPITREINAQVNTSSDISGYQLIIQNEKEFIEELKTMQILGRAYIQGENKSKIIDTVNIQLTGIEQPDHKLTQTDTGLLYSSKTTFLDNKSTIDIYLSPKTLSDNNLSPEDKGMIIQEALIVALYSYAHATQPYDQTRDEYTKILQGFGKNTKSYFRIE